jgi:hypothetical protein
MDDGLITLGEPMYQKYNIRESTYKNIFDK